MIDNPYEPTDLDNLDALVDAINERRQRRPDRAQPDVSGFPTGPQTVVTKSLTEAGVTEHEETVWVAQPVLRDTYLNKGWSDE